ncbi:folate-binding protein YgfZ [Synechococcus sp. CC9616]|uniref:CAF17-like 4Fe-4S cluster assembly/insertion protein YgfZ n=1 Tax=Synechococcus sp. CC9616 TaxID=110663 RepID=UPI0004AF942A|nr:folate-binding protein YgfZ [Synechococcus sp. CC9616]
MNKTPSLTTLRWDAEFPVLRLEGSGAESFLQGQTSADLSKNKDELIHSCWLTASGRLRALLEIRFDESGADVMVLAGDANSIQQGFDQVIFPADRVRLLSRQPQRRLQTLSDQESSEVIWHDTTAALPELWEQRPIADADALERWRLQQGWPGGDGELSGETNPFELGLSHWVSLSKGCYLGQETMAKLASKGGVKQQLRTWSSTSPLVQGTLLKRDGARAGLITSVLPNRDSPGCIGLALVRRQHLDATSLQGPTGEELILQRPSGFQDPPQPVAS